MFFNLREIMNLQSITLTCFSLGLLVLTGCGAGSPTATVPATQPVAQPTASPTSQPNPTPNSTSSPAAATSGVPNQGGMVVESGPYHLELVPEKEGSNTHLDLFLQKGDTHEPILGAKVMAQVQLPDGTQTTVDMIYDAPAKHYAGKVASVAVGEYKVAVQSEITGEKVNARFSFKQ
jgi:hypothetical protein